MIEYIKGELTELTPALATVEAAGVGYGLNISLTTYSAIQKTLSSPSPKQGRPGGVYNCPDSTISTILSVNRSVPSGSYSFFRLAPKAQANACQKPARRGPMNAWIAS